MSLFVAVAVVCCFVREKKDEDVVDEEQMNFRTKLGECIGCMCSEHELLNCSDCQLHSVRSSFAKTKVLD